VSYLVERGELQRMVVLEMKLHCNPHLCVHLKLQSRLLLGGKRKDISTLLSMKTSNKLFP